MSQPDPPQGVHALRDRAEHEERPRPVTMKFKPGSHVFTMVDPSRAEVPIIMLSWLEAQVLADLFAMRGEACPVPIGECLPCGLRQELLAMIAERGPR